MNDDQSEELGRVRRRIGDAVRMFIHERLRTKQPQFRMRELHDYILEKTMIAPASPDRILRQLRLDGECDYTVVDRRASLYVLRGEDQ
jgi:hypothetical protein